MSDINVVVISGIMGKSFPRAVKIEGEDREVANFSIMSVDDYGGKERKTVVRCVVWGEVLVRNIKLLSEGDAVLLQGRLSSGKDKEGNWVTELTVNKIAMFGGDRKTPPLPF
jgi:single-stranded DNA-binding protein